MGITTLILTHGNHYTDSHAWESLHGFSRMGITALILTHGNHCTDSHAWESLH